MALRLQSGAVWINQHGAIQPNAPFGRVKGSSIGVSFAEEGLREYPDRQTVFSSVPRGRLFRCRPDIDLVRLTD